MFGYEINLVDCSITGQGRYNLCFNVLYLIKIMFYTDLSSKTTRGHVEGGKIETAAGDDMMRHHQSV